MGNTLMSMFVPFNAETAGTQRVERIGNEPFDAQIRDAGMSVLDAMLSAARDSVVRVAAGTETGQELIRQAQQQQIEGTIQRYALPIAIAILVVVFLIGRATVK